MRVHAGDVALEPAASAGFTLAAAAYASPVVRKRTTPKKKAGDTNLEVSSTVFRVLWWLVMLYHLFNAMFIFLVGAAQVFISQPGIYESVWLLRIEQSMLAMAGWSFLLIAMAHVAAVVVNICQSLRRRRLSFGNKESSAVATKRPGHLAPQGSKASTTGGSSKDMSRKKAITLRHLLPHVWWDRYFAARGLFGVKGKLFYTGFYVRQVIEILMQTYQATQLSSSVPRRWINRLVVGMIVINCLYIPIVNVWMREQPAARRITLLTVDLLVDFVIMVLVPLLVCLPHAVEFDWVGNRYPEEYTYDDVWVTTVIFEVRQVLVSSSVDFISTVAPHLTGLATLDTIKSLIHCKPPVPKHEGPRPSAMTRSPPPMRVNVSSNNVGDEGGVAKSTATPTDDRAAKLPARLFYFFAFTWALFVVVVHGKAQAGVRRDSKVHGCQLHVGAWFATNASCSVIHLNCHAHGTHGASDDLATALSILERKALTRLIITHCPALHMPPIITEFPNLRFLQVFNSTLVSWPIEAALTQSATPLVNQLNFVATNFTEFPEGMLHDALPELMSFMIYKSNFSTVPDRFGDLWATHIWPYFSLEDTQVTSLPPSFSQLQSFRLSLTNNLLEPLADDVLGGKLFISIRLTNSTVSTLPPAVGELSELYQIMAENTNISSVPAWFDTWLHGRRSTGQKTFVSFRGSPLCDLSKYDDICHVMDPRETGDYRYDITLARLRLGA